jgi:ketosteroid isomerase-like protein
MTRSRNAKTARDLLHFMEQKKLEEFTELFAEDGRWVHPYHSGMFPPEVVGKKDIYDSIKKAASRFGDVSFPVEEVIPFEDPNRLAVKHTGHLLFKDGSGTYENDYLGIFTFDEHGKIVEWAEYYNPIKTAKAFGLKDKIKW